MRRSDDYADGRAHLLDRTRSGRVRVDPADHRKRVRPKPRPDHHSGNQEEEGRKDERSNELVKPDALSDYLLKGRQQRTEDRSERSDPNDCGDCCRLLVRLSEICGHIPTLQC